MTGQPTGSSTSGSASPGKRLEPKTDSVPLTGSGTAAERQRNGSSSRSLHLPHPLIADDVVPVEVEEHAEDHGAERGHPCQRLHPVLPLVRQTSRNQYPQRRGSMPGRLHNCGAGNPIRATGPRWPLPAETAAARAGRSPGRPPRSGRSLLGTLPPPKCYAKLRQASRLRHLPAGWRG
jgi:hypothetical protein